MHEASSNASPESLRDGLSRRSADGEFADSPADSISGAGRDVSGRGGWARIVTAAALILLPLVNFYPAVLGQLMLAPGDGWTQIIGIRILIGRLIAAGYLPLWNPYIFSGMPLLASIQPGALYPPTWLFAVLSPQAAMNWMVITTYHIALIGAYLYARRIGANRFGSMVAGVAFAFGGYMIAHLGHTNRIAAAAWLPWILLAIEALYQRLSWKWISLGALFTAMQLLAGDPQMTFYTVLLAGAYGIYSFTLRPEAERRRRFLFGAAAMSVCGALLSAIQLLPERELLRQGERAGISYEYFSGFSFPPQHVFQLIFPYFFGGGGMSPFKVVYWGKWNTTEVAGYLGMLTMMLALVALIAMIANRRQDRLVWFWSGYAVLALLMAFGHYLPFGINELLHKLPVYNLFRASGRHLLEFDFALAVLGGIGATWLSQKKNRLAHRALHAAIAAMAVIVAVSAAVYRYFADYLVMDLPVTEGAKSFANPELLIPVAFFILSVAALCLFGFARGRSVAAKGAAAAVLIALLFADLASFGYFYEWNIVPRNLNELIEDPPSVKFIKEREPDLSSFRILSHGSNPHARNYEMLNYPNVSIARGLQSANGYDPLMLVRYSSFAGGMGLDGYIQGPSALDSRDQSFNLLNVKYLFFERGDVVRTGGLIEHEGIRFTENPLNLVLQRGKEARFSVNTAATEIAVVSAMGRSNHLTNGTPVADLRIHTADGRVIERQMVAGRDTSEWAYDRADVKATIKHDRARVIESYPADGFEGRRFLSRFAFDRAEVKLVEMRFAGGGSAADVTIARASLFDATIGESLTLNAADLPVDRWQKLGEFGEVDLYENRHRMPRAWFAHRAAVMPGAQVLSTIRSGRMEDGSAFDPAETVLFEKEDFGNRQIVLPQIGDTTGSEVRVASYEPNRIELTARNPQPGFLVLSEIYYRGWDAWIDGRRAPVERVNYVLRGVAVPAGDHRIEFVFRAPTFRNGAAYSVLGIVLLVIGWVVSARRSRAPQSPASS
jgi:hypothetical protein